MKDLWELDVILNRKITFDYVNWKGVKSKRRVHTINLLFDETEWHKEKQFLLFGLDLDKQEPRAFALKDMANIEFIKTN